MRLAADLLKAAALQKTIMTLLLDAEAALVAIWGEEKEKLRVAMKGH